MNDKALFLAHLITAKEACLIALDEQIVRTREDRWAGRIAIEKLQEERLDLADKFDHRIILVAKEILTA